MDNWSIISANPIIKSPPADGPLSDWARWYHEREVTGVGSPFTQKAKRQDLEKFLNFFLKKVGNAPPSSWRKSVTQSFINRLHSSLKPASISRVLATLTCFARYLERKGVIEPDDNPLRGVQKPPRSSMKPKHIAIYAPQGEIFMEGSPAYGQFLSAANLIIERQVESGPQRFPRRVWPYRDKALLEFLYHTGLRVSEVCNINLDQMRDAPQHKARIFIDVICKGNKKRDIFLDSIATQGLVEYFTHERRTRPGPLFPSPRGKGPATSDDLTMRGYDLVRLSASSVTAVLHRIARESCSLLGRGYYYKIHPHRLRHERGYNLKMAGADAGDIQKELGHSTPAYAPLYSQPTDDERYEWLNSIGKKHANK